MSLRPIEMQVALPRTVDAASQQQQMMQKAVHDQAALGQQNVRQAELARKRAAKTEQEREWSADADSHTSGRRPSERSDKHREKNGNGQAEFGSGTHPYKGKHIDFSL